jgi:hypothetical protein
VVGARAKGKGGVQHAKVFGSGLCTARTSQNSVTVNAKFAENSVTVNAKFAEISFHALGMLEAASRKTSSSWVHSYLLNYLLTGAAKAVPDG